MKIGGKRSKSVKKQIEIEIKFRKKSLISIIVFFSFLKKLYFILFDDSFRSRLL